MNILFLALDVDSRQMGGEETHVRELVKGFETNGHEVTFVDWTNVDVVAPHYPRNLHTARALTKLARESGIDLIYERRYSAKMSWYIARTLGIPYMVEVNGIGEEQAPMLGKPFRDNLIKKAMRRKFLREAEAVIVPLPTVQSRLQERYKLENVRLVLNGVDTEKFRPMDRDEARFTVGWDDENEYVLWSGKMYPWQGVNHLVQAMKIVRNQRPKVELAIVTPDYKDNGIPWDWAAVGHIPHEHMPTQIAAADLCFYSILGLKSYEYMACQRPTVALKHPDNVFPCPQVEPDGLADLILNRLENYDEAMEEARGFRRDMVEHRQWRHVADEVVGFVT